MTPLERMASNQAMDIRIAEAKVKIAEAEQRRRDRLWKEQNHKNESVPSIELLKRLPPDMAQAELSYLTDLKVRVENRIDILRNRGIA
jgi:hypothetical protein